MRSHYLVFNKPFRVLCQFRPDGGKETLAEYITVPDVYPVGRLDYDSEGLVLLTDDGPLQHFVSDPRFAHSRTYWVQVEGIVSSAALEALSQGVTVAGKRTLPCHAEAIVEPELPQRVPPVRFRKHIPTSWLSLTLREGRNRQVRHMTAAVGYPTLRLVRAAIGPVTLEGLQPGTWRHLAPGELSALRRPNSQSGKSRAGGAAHPHPG